MILEPEIKKLNFNLVARFGAHTDLIKDLNNGILDLVITPKKQVEKKSLVEYIPFSKERIVLIAGIKTDTSIIKSHINSKNLKKIEEELLKNLWYSSSNELNILDAFGLKTLIRNQVLNPIIFYLILLLLLDV
ncbi:hypothetical protein [Polaribacter sp. OB-PA-B3]